MAETKQSPQAFPAAFLGSPDGNVLNAALGTPVWGSDDGVTASTTQTRAGGFAIKYPITRISSANASDAVTLGGPGAVVKAGSVFAVINESGATIQVFPPGASDTIDGGSVGAAVNLGNNKGALFFASANIGGVVTWVSLAAAKSS